MSASIKGIQDAGVQACAKHIIGYEQETQRTNSISLNGTRVEAISSNIDDRTMHELYLWPFADAVKAGVAAVMCSYNRVNQTYACENSKLMNGLLKQELGFQGYVVSDYFATHSGVQSALAGLDMNMPGPLDSASSFLNGSFFGKNLTTSVMKGLISEDRLNDMARRVLAPYFLLGQDVNFPTIDLSLYYILAQTYGVQLDLADMPNERDVRGTHAALIRELGAAGIVLLKNTNTTLPLQSPKNIGIFGNDAPDVTDGLSYQGATVDTPQFGFNIGTLTVGGGSGSARSTYIVSPFQAIRNRTDARLQYILDNEFIAKNDFSSIFPPPEICLVFLKTWASETVDRTSFENDYNSTVVVNNVASHCPNTVVITHSAGVNTMPWASNPNVTAILAAHYPGQESGNAIADVLFGDVNPSGHLPYTIPITDGDYNIPVVNITGPAAYESSAWQSDFTEGLMIDYRHFDARNITPLYEFGFGLSYTTFNISKRLSVRSLKAELSSFPSTAKDKPIPGGNPDLWTKLFHASTTVSNTGNVSGAAVVQLYLSFSNASVPAGTPVKVLRGFNKVLLAPGQSANVDFELTRRDVSFWNVTAQDWQIPVGIARLSVGFSSRDLHHYRDIELA